MSDDASVVAPERDGHLVDGATGDLGQGLTGAVDLLVELACVDVAPIEVGPAVAPDLHARRDEHAHGCAIQVARCADPPGAHEERGREVPLGERRKGDLDVGGIAVVKGDLDRDPRGLDHLRDRIENGAEPVRRAPVGPFVSHDPIRDRSQPVEAQDQPLTHARHLLTAGRRGSTTEAAGL